MRLKKTEWMLIAVMGGSIAGFGNWLQSEMNRAAIARSQRNTEDAPDSHAFCSGMSTRESQMMDKGALWCGSIDVSTPAHADSLSKG
ncbi:MAG: hypothetical protein CPDRYMAC_1711 [uncultured Paraburkholderia sp.]|nr:MAG: hypothetical protein CPDRYDRY_1682 [uncultured Paraburkholderia sp.]CAH2919951.1 MAG: hypothetical protein CPDRYMAC_1711 [uncultured Paraburkholderia sp.]